MALFSDVLLTSDFDRTITDPAGHIPQRNLEAIRYFIENGGAFTVNTGRSYASFRAYAELVPHNAPLLLLNGSGCWENGKFRDQIPLKTDVWTILEQLRTQFPQVNLELQNLDIHYLVEPRQEYVQYYSTRSIPHAVADRALHRGPFLKIGIYGDMDGALGVSPEEEAAAFDRVQEFLDRQLGQECEILRATPRIINIHAKGVSKLAAARQLKQRLGRKLLICVGDEGNDIPMLQGADYAFCPGDSAVADRFPTVCSSSAGALADVIYEKIPQILKG